MLVFITICILLGGKCTIATEFWAILLFFDWILSIVIAENILSDRLSVWNFLVQCALKALYVVLLTARQMANF